MCKAAPKAPEAAPLVSEIDNSNSVIHLNVQATYIMGIVSTVFLVCILFFLLCMCCGKKFKKLRLWCCNGCTSSVQHAETGRVQSNSPCGGWHSPAQQPGTQLQTWQDPHQAARQQCKSEQRSLQGPSALQSSSTSDPSWASGSVYPSVPSCPQNSPNSSVEEI